LNSPARCANGVRTYGAQVEESAPMVRAVQDLGVEIKRIDPR